MMMVVVVKMGDVRINEGDLQAVVVIIAAQVIYQSVSASG